MVSLNNVVCSIQRIEKGLTQVPALANDVRKKQFARAATNIKALFGDL